MGLNSFRPKLSPLQQVPNTGTARKLLKSSRQADKALEGSDGSKSLKHKIFRCSLDFVGSRRSSSADSRMLPVRFWAPVWVPFAPERTEISVVSSSLAWCWWHGFAGALAALESHFRWQNLFKGTVGH